MKSNKQKVARGEKREQQTEERIKREREREQSARAPNEADCGEREGEDNSYPDPGSVDATFLSFKRQSVRSRKWGTQMVALHFAP